MRERSDVHSGLDVVVSRRKPSGFYGFPNSFAEKKIGAPATSRNWSTIKKIEERLRVQIIKVTFDL